MKENDNTVDFDPIALERFKNSINNRYRKIFGCLEDDYETIAEILGVPLSKNKKKLKEDIVNKFMEKFVWDMAFSTRKEKEKITNEITNNIHRIINRLEKELENSK
ncbi:hypothetical protein [Clostridium formicaceticum]|uniref:Uncharacterized protein n=1 Tax=Clostridium formicaceticum TaxID=1497 RepID=A0AAC9RKK3_9CLOT|nr:hypothetical protein [Clostridium formicaceticum]AOY76889.1 hypothetical protein BJL90_14125 [Clostridium formicaceticum]ARE87369.1 hypothetical protein CLFO_17690 [Clostridium formicaceticum]